jgi:uncharacterized OB-fold protein
MEWYCFKDKAAMAETDVKLVYLSSDDFKHNYTFKGIKCPKCGATYIPEAMAIGRLTTAEGLAEGK